MANLSVSFGGSSPPTTAGERRAWVRVRTELEALCQPGSGRLDSAWWLAKICDISVGGLGLVLRRRFEPGTILTVDLDSPARKMARTFQAQVRHATTGTDGTWVVGCALANRLSDEELEALW